MVDDGDKRGDAQRGRGRGRLRTPRLNASTSQPDAFAVQLVVPVPPAPTLEQPVDHDSARISPLHGCFCRRCLQADLLQLGSPCDLALGEFSHPYSLHYHGTKL